jgi:CHAD domain-containing protein
MQQPGADTWLLPDTLQVDALLAALGAEFGCVAAPEYAASVVYADSFDWRLYQQGYLLHCHGSSWTLYHGDGCEVTLQQGGPELKTACFAHDFPPGRLRETLTPMLGVRCLLPLAAVQLSGRQLRLLNSDQKTVARLVIETQQPAGLDTAFRLIRLFPVRGYDHEQALVQTILADKGVRRTVSPLIGFEAGCRKAGRLPLDYSSKFASELDAEDTARRAMARIYQALLDNINRNIPGVLADWDTEFLHDLRVAVRRTRSGLSLVKKVLPGEVAARFKRDFGLLGGLTGPTRDLDVYLLNRDVYLKRLPPTLQPGLSAFFDQLARRRQTEQKRLTRALRGRKSKAMLAAWGRCLHGQDRQPAPLAATPIGELAGRIILRRYKQVLEKGGALNAATPDAEVHRLRIECKKLRYAMEFFSSLYPREEIQQVVRHLKKLQDILGDFNDLSVQQQMLRQGLEALHTGSRRNLEQASALGGLLQSLFEEQQALRQHFAEAFEQFSDPETTALARELFRKKHEDSP